MTVGLYGAAGESRGMDERKPRNIMGSARYVAAAAAGCAVVLLAVSTRMGMNGPAELGQTSMNSALAHPYNSMHLAPWYVTENNPNGHTTKPVNPAPFHPYHAGVRPKMVHNRDFEHQPFGNHLPWEDGPEGAVAKTVRRGDKLRNYRYMVNRDGIVREWEQKAPMTSLGSHGQMSPEALAHLSPMPEPEASAHDIAQALLHRQENDVRKSFRSIYPDGMFHDSIVDARTGHSFTISAANAPEVTCPAGLFKCHDGSCSAHVSYCPGCNKIPLPSYCASVSPEASGWGPSAVGCNIHDFDDCNMAQGNTLFMPGETTTGGVFGSGLA